MNRKCFLGTVAALACAPMAAWSKLTEKTPEVPLPKQEDKIENHGVFLFSTARGFVFRKEIMTHVRNETTDATYGYCVTFSPYFDTSRDACAWLKQNHPQTDLRYAYQL